MERVSFEEAVLRGLPSFDGLFFPLELNPLPKEFWGNIENLSFHEIAFHALE